MTRVPDGPRRRRMIRGTIARISELAMRYGHLSQLATLDCTSSRRSTVMCALPRATVVITEYQRDSSSKRPRSSVVSAARPPTRRRTTCRTRHPGLRALRAAPSAPLDTASARWSRGSYASKLTLAGHVLSLDKQSGLYRGSFHIRLAARGERPAACGRRCIPAVRCFFLKYCPVVSVVAPCRRGASACSVRRPVFHHDGMDSSRFRCDSALYGGATVRA